MKAINLNGCCLLHGCSTGFLRTIFWWFSSGFGVDSFEWCSVGCDQMFTQIPLIFDDFVAEWTGHPLRLDMHVDNVLFQIERIGKSFPTVVTETGLHTSPTVTWMICPPSLNYFLIIVIFWCFYNKLISRINLGFFLFLQFFHFWCSGKGFTERRVICKN